MTHLFKFLFICSFCMSCAQIVKNSSKIPRENLSQMIDQYGEKSSRFLTELEQNQLKNDQIIKQSEMLIELAKPILKNVMLSNKNRCKSYLKSTLFHIDQMKKSSPKMMEENYKKGSVLGSADPLCQYVKDLVVRPAAMIVLTKKSENKDKDQLVVEELKEAIWRIDLISEDLFSQSI
ncbi:MAG: hypothetical protein HOE90_17330 [Bacteriovoracaceae bacterium]|jgi:hypothetical protein|nr:hypothetical protein [Bacteriovoracaceae bacterium]